MKEYTSICVELPQCPQIARIIWPDQKRIYVNAAAHPGANIDYLIATGTVFLALSPTGKLPDGEP